MNSIVPISPLFVPISHQDANSATGVPRFPYLGPRKATTSGTGITISATMNGIAAA